MPIPVLPSDIAKIVTVKKGYDVTELINVATELAAEVCGPTTTAGYTDQQMFRIVQYLTAHFYRIYDRERVLKAIDTIKIVYDSKIGFSLDNTAYGQQLKIIEFRGFFAALENRQKKAIVPRAYTAYLGRNRRRGGCDNDAPGDGDQEWR